MVSHKELANAIRILSIDAIQKANSGHPGAPMGFADVAEVLWRHCMKYNPINPNWINRDRLVLSNGHASMLLYSALHLSGYDITLNDIKNFRQLHSKTPGHPEFGYTPGVETTTGPLGQGIANAVGFAIAERTLSAQFNRLPYKIIDHYTYVIFGDGCIMEGISHEVCSLAGTLKLGKLIGLYDDNGISIDGQVNGWFTDNTTQRFLSYGWHVIDNINGHDANDIKKSINKAKLITDKPSLLIFKTVIGFGSPNKSGTHQVHGAPLGDHERHLTCNTLSWKYDSFNIPEYIYKKWDAKKKGKALEQAWNLQFQEYKKLYPKLAEELNRRIQNILPMQWHNKSLQFALKSQLSKDDLATRQASLNTIEYFSKMLPEYLGGSADLASSNLTLWTQAKSINKDVSGNYIHYGVREFGMTAIANGLALYKGFLPFTATFLIFSEYARNAIRMAALMKIRHVLIYTHDSIGLGEDGPTHQPIEQISNLRSIPNLSTWRPCDQVETAIAWAYAIERIKGPTALVLSRQILKKQKRTKNQLLAIKKGGYILKDSHEKIKLILIATGSEVDIAVSVYNDLKQLGYKVRVVSMPSTDVFDKQDSKYRELVLPYTVTARLAIEAGSADYWIKYVGLNGIVVGLKTFGESAPADKLFNFFGFNKKNIIKKAINLINKKF